MRGCWMNVLERLFEQSQTPGEYAGGYLKHLSELCATLDLEAIERVVNLFFQARKDGKRVFFVGNGGSAATASHFANDLAIGTRSKTQPYKIISLTDNNAVMTAIANDFGYENMFVKQLEAVYEQGDLLVAISASGNSENLLRAVQYVKDRQGITIGLTGFDGGKLMEMADYVIHAPTAKGEYGPVEDIHLVLDHIIGTYLMYKCREET
jgi:D-sedoheptulose 7-phosphate isomerase